MHKPSFCFGIVLGRTGTGAGATAGIGDVAGSDTCAIAGHPVLKDTASPTANIFSSCATCPAAPSQAWDVAGYALRTIDP